MWVEEQSSWGLDKANFGAPHSSAPFPVVGVDSTRHGHLPRERGRHSQAAVEILNSLHELHNTRQGCTATHRLPEKDVLLSDVQFK